MRGWEAGGIVISQAASNALADADHAQSAPANSKSASDKLANGKTWIDFQTEPSRYRHWKLAVDDDIATLTMDVDEKAGLFEG